MVAVILVILVNAPVWFSIPTGGEILLLLSFPLIPAAVTIAVLRHGLYDVRIVLSRVVVYVTAHCRRDRDLRRDRRAARSDAARQQRAPVLAALAIALAFNPVRVGLATADRPRRVRRAARPGSRGVGSRTAAGR